MSLVTFSDLLGGDCDNPNDFFQIPWLHSIGHPLECLGIKHFKPRRCDKTTLILSVDGKIRGQRWSIGVADDSSSTGIFTGGHFRAATGLLGSPGKVDIAVAEMLAVLAALEWACQKNAAGGKYTDLKLITDRTSWISNYQAARSGSLPTKVAGYEATLHKVMQYMRRALDFFDTITVLHKSVSAEHGTLTPEEYIPDQLASRGLSYETALDKFFCSSDPRDSPRVYIAPLLNGLCTRAEFILDPAWLIRSHA